MDPVCEINRWPLQMSATPSGETHRKQRAPVDGHDQLRPDQPRCPGRSLGIHVAGSKGVPPSPDRQQGEVDTRQMYCHFVVNIGVTCEIDLSGALNQKADRIGPSPKWPAAPIMLGRNRRDGNIANRC